MYTPSVFLKVFIIGRKFYTKKAGLKKKTWSYKNKETLQKSFKVAYSIEFFFIFQADQRLSLDNLQFYNVKQHLAANCLWKA